MKPFLASWSLAFLILSLAGCGDGVTADTTDSGGTGTDGGGTGTDGGGTDGGGTGTDGGSTDDSGTGTDDSGTVTDDGGTDAATSCASDGVDCTVDGIDGTGACAHLPSDVLCLPGGTCDATAGCMYPTGCDPTTCDDSNPCTIDGCAMAGGGCAHTVNLGASCDDGMATTSSDHCVSMGGGAGGPTGVCLGSPISCDDMNPCTRDVLDAAGACTHPPTDQPCTDNDPCTMRDHCNMGVCVSTMPVMCAASGTACCAATGSCLPAVMCIAP